MDVQPASPSKKQGEEQKDLVRQDSKPGKFRIIAQLVKAAKRFEGNPLAPAQPPATGVAPPAARSRR